MNNLTKKIVAIVTTLSMAAWAMPVGALTLEERIADLEALIAEYMATIAELKAELEGDGAVAIEGVPADFEFVDHMAQGDSGVEVKYLQIVLNTVSGCHVADEGWGSAGNETENFGPLTNAAVVNFQEKYSEDVLDYWGLTSGTGYAGDTTIAKLNELLTAGVGEEEEEEEEEEEVTGPAAIELAADTPEAAQTALNAQDVLFTKIKFSGGDDGVTISKIIVSRSGVSADTDVASIKLYDGTTQVGSTQALNTNTHKATFSSLSWEVPAGETKVLTIKASIAGKGTATVGDSIKLGIALASDITATATLEGTFPIYGKAMITSGTGVGELFVATTTVPAAATILSGAVDQEIASWKFTASSSEGVSIHSIKITHVGTATRDDVKNVKLTVNGVQVGETVESLAADNTATFDLSSSPISILKSASKTVYAYCDVGSGIWTARTIRFEITQYTDVVAYGENSGGSIMPAYTDSAAFKKQTGSIMTIGQGTFTVALDASLNPAKQTYVVGTENRLMTAFKFTTGSREGVRVVKLSLKLAGSSAAATDISNVTLWDGTTQIAGPASIIGSYVTFGSNTIGWDTTGLFDMERSTNKTIQVKADIPTGANTIHTVSLSIAANTDVWIDGLDSKYDVAQSSITLSSGTGTAHALGTRGSLAVSLSSGTPATQIYVIGATEKEFAKVNLTADSGENITVSAITVDCYEGASSASSVCSSDHHLTNMRILKSDGTQYGSTKANPTSASSTFSGSLTVAASETETLSVVADVPVSSYPRYIKLQIDGADITCTGVSSSATITATDAGTGKEMAISYGSLTAAAAASPADQNVIIGSTKVSYLGIIFTAGTAEDVRITSVRLAQTSSTDIKGCINDVSHIALYDGDTRLTTEKALTAAATNTVTFSASDFLNSSGIDITKGQQKTITVKADVPSTATANHLSALGIPYSTDITGSGLLSNQAASVTLTASPSGATGVNFVLGGNAALYEVTCVGKGTLTASKAADTPTKSIVAVGDYTQGTSDIAFLKVDFKAAKEDVAIISIEVERTESNQSDDADFGVVSLWDGSTQIGGDQNLVNASTTFNLPVGSYWIIPAGETKTLTVKADLKGMKTADVGGSITGHNPILCLAAGKGADGSNLKITGKGVGSGLTINASSSADICGHYQIVHQSKPTIAAASLPSTVYGAGEKVLYRWTVTADDKGDIGWQKVIFKMSGSVTIGSDSCTIGYGASTSTAAVNLATGTTDISARPTLIATGTLKVYNVGTAEQVSATGAGMAVWNYMDGGARIAFTPAAEEVVAKGTTKTYELKGDLGYGGSTGDSISTKIESIASATTTDVHYATALGGLQSTYDTGAFYNVGSFIWTDRSGYSATWGSDYSHCASSSDWTYEWKVSGIPTATLSLSK